MNADDLDRELHAFRDGELSWLGRARVALRLRRDADARRRLAALERTAALLREIDADGPTPDLWDAIRLRLPAIDVARSEAAAPRGTLAPAFGWGAGALAAAAVAAALVLQLGPPALEPAAIPAPNGAVRWLDGRGLPMMVLRDDAEATIIWVPERPAGESTSGEGEAIGGLV
jgi:anti-sigma-K factor RskA